jgi:hypothetical protein
MTQSPLDECLSKFIARDMDVPPEKVTLENIRRWRGLRGTNECVVLGHEPPVWRLEEQSPVSK